MEADGLSNEVKSELLGYIRSHKKFGLVWEDKPEDVEERLQNELPVLTEVKEKAIISDEENAPNHILIEGDNLQVLTTLVYSHERKIDVIYIDPPYNTGNKDFKYNDCFVDKEDEYRHSKWLSFMEKRLKIAKKLLSMNGVIFISIDDNELSHLKLLCDEIFSEKNFIAKFDWRKKTGANDAKDIAVITESVLLYGNNRENTIANDIWSRDADSINKDRYKYKDEYSETRGLFYYDTLDRGGLQYSDSMNFGIKAPDGGMIYPNGRASFVNDGWIWKWGKEKVEWGINNGFLTFVKSNKSKGSAYTIKYKVYQNVDNEGNIRTKAGRAFSNLIVEPINQQGNSELKQLFNGDCSFSNPKPIGLIQYLLKTLKSKTSTTILDFFAGSGTTLHATMQLNKDGGNRRCILVTNNENNICEEVTYERNKKVIKGYTTPKGEHIPGLTNNTLRYYKTGFVPAEKTNANKRALVAAATDMLCIKNDIYTEQELFTGRKLKKNIARYFDDGKKQMLIIYNELAVHTFAELIREHYSSENKLLIYVFSVNSYTYTDTFEEVLDKVKLCALPDAIYKAYKSVIKPKRKFSEQAESIVEGFSELENEEMSNNEAE